MSLKSITYRLRHGSSAKPVAKAALEPIGGYVESGRTMVNPLVLAGLFVS